MNKMVNEVLDQSNSFGGGYDSEGGTSYSPDNDAAGEWDQEQIQQQDDVDGASSPRLMEVRSEFDDMDYDNIDERLGLSHLLNAGGHSSDHGRRRQRSLAGQDRADLRRKQKTVSNNVQILPWEVVTNGKRAPNFYMANSSRHTFREPSANCPQTCLLGCNGNGACDCGKCVCNTGFYGEDCSLRKCDSDCSNHGTCVNGTCICISPCFGRACAATSCGSEADCGPHGACVMGVCQCNRGWKGCRCSEIDYESDCEHDCGPHGQCIAGECVCDNVWTGPNCTVPHCPQGCNGRGNCVEGGICECTSGFFGTSCSRTTCPNECSNNGVCYNHECLCKPEYTGDDCSFLKCTQTSLCPANRTCLDGKCVCKPGLAGPDCRPDCPKHCDFLGTCVAGVCQCPRGLSGEDCTIASCPLTRRMGPTGLPIVCSGHGVCVLDTLMCKCDVGYKGEDCSELTCIGHERGRPCSDNGVCVDGVCLCGSGWRGVDCSIPTCPAACNNRGLCVNSTCMCRPGFTGPDCSARECPGLCHGHGICQNSTCSCFPGYSGPDCTYRLCPQNCSDHGFCYNGTCFCENGFGGTDCSLDVCGANCRHGLCHTGNCYCHDGWKGRWCDEPDCPDDCSGHGTCFHTGRRTNNEPTTLDDALGQLYASPSKSFSTSVDGYETLCLCDHGYTGTNCSYLACGADNACSGNGICVGGKECECDLGFTGADCSERVCAGGGSCTNNGFCLTGGDCLCYPGFLGDDCASQGSDYSPIKMECAKSCHSQCLQRCRFDAAQVSTTGFGA